MQPQPSVAVAGGGISGLAAALKLTELLPHAKITLFEQQDRLGGILETVQQDGYLIERAADMFITEIPHAVQLCRRIGLGDSLVSTDDRFRRAFVVKDGQLQPVPQGFSLMAPAKMGPILSTRLLSWPGKLRLFCEPIIPRRKDTSDESLAAFARRRLGREAFDRLVQPLVGGIYTADAEKLSMQSALPRFVDMERNHGSLWRGMRRQTSRTADQEGTGARYGLFVAPKLGMSSLVEALRAALVKAGVRILLKHGIQELQTAANANGPAEGPLRLMVASSSGTTYAHPADAAILALPAARLAPLFAADDPRISQQISQIEAASAAVVTLGYQAEQLSRPLTGFGFVVPERERLQILSASFASMKFPGRAPAGHQLIRVFLGGAKRPEVVDWPDERLAETALADLQSLIGQIHGPPVTRRIERWKNAMPQYHLGHKERVAEIWQRAADRFPQVALCGNAWHGVGIPQCIASGEQAAETIAAKLALRSA